MNIAFCAYAFKQEYQTGHNMQSDDAENIYLKNSYVALKSCKYYNPETEVALVTNLQLSDYWKNLFEAADIKIFVKEYDEFVFDKKYGWSLAFYKLCALKYILEKDYKNILLMDTDTYTQREFDDIWIECKHNILMYDISRGLYNKDYRVFCEEAQKFLDTDEILTRWGGEFIAGNKKDLQHFILNCETRYNQIQQQQFATINGDEFIESVAAWDMRDKIKNAAAYIFRYWTAYRWHYICSNYIHNPVCILHCPREKNYGFVKLFKYMTKRDNIPPLSLVHRFLHLNNLSFLKIEFINKIANLKN